MARQYTTAYGQVVVRTYDLDDEFVRVVAVLHKDGTPVDATRCEATFARATEDEHRAQRRMMVSAVVDKFRYFERENTNYTPDEVAVGVIGIINARLRQQVYG